MNPIELHGRYVEALTETLRGYRECALVDFPDHSNVGDSAIWLGEIRALQEIGVAIRYVSTATSFSEVALRAALPGGVVLIHGGGNFGTLWPNHQSFRESLFATLRDYRIVQLPQTLYFDDVDAASRCRQVMAAHPQLTLMVRDEPSQRIALEMLGVSAVMAPDSAFCLAGELRRRPPDIDVMVLSRSDKERAGGGLDGIVSRLPGVSEVHDWLEEPTSRVKTIAAHVRRRAKGRFGGAALYQRALLALWNRLAEERVRRGCLLLSRGRAVVTDRLHAHILCTLMDIPHAVLDNNYGKVLSFSKQWTQGNASFQVVSSLDEAAHAVESLLSGERLDHSPVA